MRTRAGLAAGNDWTEVPAPTGATLDNYRSSYTYDANGNILSADRWDQSGAQYDALKYKYQGTVPPINPPTPSKLIRNRLYELYDDDVDPNDDGATEDIMAVNDPNTTPPLTPELSHDAGLNSTSNYHYDALGNLIHDEREQINEIQWTVSGKVKAVTRTTGSTLPPLEFAYGASGQRISKQVGGAVGDPGTYREHYIRDAQGNIMATYRLHANGAFRLQERPIYGSSRVGLYAAKVDLYPAGQIVPLPQVIPVFDGLLRYELNDHLGNVGTVVTGRLQVGQGAPHEAEVISAQGYEPFGSLLPGRNYSSGSYRYLFQGQEHDDEINGAPGTSYAFEYRIHDPRVGRFLSIDPLAAKYPHNSPYAFSENRVLDGIELEGLEWQPLAENGDKVAADADNISCYEWVGYCEVAYNYNGQSHQSPPTDPCTTFSTVGVRGPEGTVSTAYLPIGNNAMEKYTSDPDNLCGNVAYAALQQADITTIGTLDAALQPGARNLLLRANLDMGVDLRITQAVRTIDEQNNLYAQGRTQAQLNRVGLHGVRARPDLAVVTRARGGQSAHNFGLAFDVARRGGDPYNVNWNTLGALGTSVGLDWGGYWDTPDRPHFQVPNWRNLIPAE